MEFLKSLFEKGALTWEQFQQAVKDAKFEVVNASGGAYVPKADLDTKEQELTTANNTIKDLRAAAKAWDGRSADGTRARNGKAPKKLEDDLKGSPDQVRHRHREHPPRCGDRPCADPCSCTRSAADPRGALDGRHQDQRGRQDHRP